MTDDSRTTMIGPVGHTVIANVERLRAARRMSLRGLSARLAEIGRPIGPNQLHALSKGGRRVDADDLVAFAKALGVTPADLLEPPPACGPIYDHPALLAAAGDPQASARARCDVDRALRRVRIELEELLADARAQPRDSTKGDRPA